MTITLSDFDKLSLPWPAEGNAWDGLPMARVGLRAALYFGDGYGAGKRQALMNIIERYVAFAGGRIRAYQRAGDWRRQEASDGLPVDLAPLRAAVDTPGAGFAIEMSAEADVAVASHWSMVTVANANGYLLLHFPVAAFEGAAPHTFRNLFQKWCSDLNALHAYAGLGLVLPVGGLSLGAALSRCGPYLRRFVGLDADDPVSTALWCREGIRTVNWLTAIDSKLLSKVGGEAEVLRVAGKEVEAEPYSNGTVFISGVSAQLGDAQGGVFPTAFSALGRAVAPLRVDIPNAWLEAPADYHAPPGFSSKSGWGEAEPEELSSLHYTKSWMARFDGT